jgi:energy-coupling factor transporter ATP-binding protein EcfA2
LINQINLHVQDNKIVKTTFTKKGKPIFKQMYYPKFIDSTNTNIVKNNCNLNKNMIITGPNASGKTTTLKTALINIILSQQTGFGFYESAEFEPYDMIHCYINIPDTSGRDSLFQAEARRCKEILDQVMDIKDKNKKQRHFCVFDELYSGTNPYEAIFSGDSSSFPTIAKVQPLSRSYFKMIEMLGLIHFFDTFPKDTPFISAHICEGPGGFIQHVVEQLEARNIPTKAIHAMTLKPSKSHIPGWKKSIHFMNKYKRIENPTTITS